MAEPYYQDKHVTLYHGDCLEADAWLIADVLVTDPPYGMGFFSEWRVDSTGKRMRGTLGRTANGVKSDHDTSVRDAVLERWQGPALVFGKWSALQELGW